MSSIHTKATDWLKQLESGACTSTEITQLYLDQIECHDSTIQAFLQVNRDAALQQAGNIDQRRQAGQPVGRLAGLPVAVKDILCSLDQPATCGSRQLENFKPPYDATVMARLKQEDAVTGSAGGSADMAYRRTRIGTSSGSGPRTPWPLRCVALPCVIFYLGRSHGINFLLILQIRGGRHSARTY